ncbi:hypothetical protein [Streptomyces thermocarboxydovorans]|uniref:hypothetical protein n=1 Tax=Streptomyces thermocarboxydovorans TaxID=59298 RepID=UPI0031D9300D
MEAYVLILSVVLLVTLVAAPLAMARRRAKTRVAKQQAGVYHPSVPVLAITFCLVALGLMIRAANAEIPWAIASSAVLLAASYVYLIRVSLLGVRSGLNFKKRPEAQPSDAAAPTERRPLLDTLAQIAGILSLFVSIIALFMS